LHPSLQHFAQARLFFSSAPVLRSRGKTAVAARPQSRGKMYGWGRDSQGHVEYKNDDIKSTADATSPAAVAKAIARESRHAQLTDAKSSKVIVIDLLNDIYEEAPRSDKNEEADYGGSGNGANDDDAAVAEAEKQQPKSNEGKEKSMERWTSEVIAGS